MNKPFSIDLNEVLVQEKEELRTRFIKQAKTTANDLITEHFSSRRTYDAQNRLTVQKGAGFQQIEDLIATKFIDDAGMNAYMERFFNENFERLMNESMELAMKHHCNCLAFAKVKEHSGKSSSMSFNPAEGSPETALQMAAVMSQRDNKNSGNG